MNYLFWRFSLVIEDHHFAWILWYVWKGRNSKIFNNLDTDPKDILKLAEYSGLKHKILWAEAQNSLMQGLDQTRSLVAVLIPIIPGR